MSEQLAVMPLADWQEIVARVKEKTGKEDALVSGEVADEIASIEKASHSDYINPEWTNWKYFSCEDNRNDLVAKLKFDDTSKGETFNQMFYNCKNLTTIPSLNTSNGTDFTYMFYGCSILTTIPSLNTSKGTNFSYMFSNCSKLTTIPSLNTNNGTKFERMFSNCKNLTTIPSLNTSNGTDFTYMFYGCSILTTIPSLNTSKGTNFSYMFDGCSNLTNITFVGTFPIKGNISVFSKSPNLTVDSLMSFINALSDNTGLSTTYKVTIGSTNLAKLTPEQIQIATNKNITLA